MSNSGTRARVHLRRSRSVSASDAHAGGPTGYGAPRIGVRNGKLVDLRPVPPPPIGGATNDPPAYEPIGKPTGRIEAVLIAMFVIALLLPVSWSLGPLRMTPFLLYLTAGFLPLVVMWLGRKHTKVILPDVLMLAFCCWSTAALIVNGGLNASLEPIGVQWLTTLGAYLTGRLLVRDARSLRWLVAFMVGAIVLLLPLLLVEMLTGSKPLLQLGRLLGNALPAVNIEPRFGMHRAQGSFEHPIALGIFTGSMFAPAVLILGGNSVAKRFGFGAATVVASVSSVSTAALLSLNVQVGLMIWSRALRMMQKRWRILAALLIAMYVAVDLVSTRTPFHVFVNYATFSQGSSYNRILIWQFGSAEALRHPFFGVGMGDWTRPSWMSSSMDNFWLVEAVRYGIPSFALLAATLMTTLWRMGKIAVGNPELIILRRAMTFSLLGTAITVGSAHLWNASYVWFMFVIGASGWLAQIGGDTRAARATT